MAKNNFKDLTGQRFGKLIAIKPTDKRKDKCVIWLCKCDCGNLYETKSNALIFGRKSCGCLRFEKKVYKDKKKCSKCGFELSLNEFYINKQTNQFFSVCKECKAEYRKKWRKRNGLKSTKPKKWKSDNKEIYLRYKKRRKLRKKLRTRERQKEKQRIDYHKNKYKNKRKVDNRGFVRRYGITLKEREIIIDKQNGRCLICDKKLDRTNKRKSHVDHNHDTGEVRGILCFHCNTGLGNFEENISLLERAIEYIKYNYYNKSIKYNKHPEYLKERRIELIKEQNNECAICNIELDRNEYNTRSVLDHSYDTKTERQVLCSKCNLGLGRFEKRRKTEKVIKIIDKAIEYLK